MQCSEDRVTPAQVLQKAVDVALAVLREIEDFSESLRGRELSVARGESPAAAELATPAAAMRKLRQLIGACCFHQHCRRGLQAVNACTGLNVDSWF